MAKLDYLRNAFCLPQIALTSPLLNFGCKQINLMELHVCVLQTFYIIEQKDNTKYDFCIQISGYPVSIVLANAKRINFLAKDRKGR